MADYIYKILYNHSSLYRKEAALKQRSSSKGEITDIRNNNNDFEGIVSDDMKDEMRSYIRRTKELNRSLYEITNNPDPKISSDTISVLEKKTNKKEHIDNNGLYALDRGIKKFHNNYERVEDKLIVDDVVNTVWETGEKLSEVLSVELSSKFIGSRSKKIYFVSKSLLTISNCIFSTTLWMMISSSYKLKSLVKSSL